VGEVKEVAGSRKILMVRRRVSAVSNHEAGIVILRDAAQWPLLRMRKSWR
jgi:hypothetical protein